MNDVPNWETSEMITTEYVTSISTGNWFNPTLDFYTQYDLSEYTRNEDVDGIHYEYIDLEDEENGESTGK